MNLIINKKHVSLYIGYDQFMLWKRGNQLQKKLYSRAAISPESFDKILHLMLMLAMVSSCSHNRSPEDVVDI